MDVFADERHDVCALQDGVDGFLSYHNVVLSGKCPAHARFTADLGRDLLLFRSILFRFQIAYILTFKNVP